MQYSFKNITGKNDAMIDKETEIIVILVEYLLCVNYFCITRT